MAQNVINLDDEKLDINREIMRYLPRVFDAKNILQNRTSLGVINKYNLQLPQINEATIAVLGQGGKVLGVVNTAELAIGSETARDFLQVNLPDKENAREIYQAAKRKPNEKAKKSSW